ncbi:MAG TPA: DUF6491 family protein [Woeseiaceae bacterium]|nr:DUF6491 family protein [Woeseiaceae bacterium]
MMKTTVLACSLALLAACAGTPEIPPDTQAVRDYVEVGELQDVDRIRTHGNDGWRPLTLHYAIYSGRDGRFLLEFNRICREMYDNTMILPDRRYDHNAMRRGIDTLRGCRIDAMYPLSEAQAEELEALVKSADSGN